jgi:hypothetical protein
MTAHLDHTCSGTISHSRSTPNTVITYITHHRHVIFPIKGYKCIINFLHLYSGDPADNDDLVGANMSEVTMEDANRILNSNKDEMEILNDLHNDVPKIMTPAASIQRPDFSARRRTSSTTSKSFICKKIALSHANLQFNC